MLSMLQQDYQRRVEQREMAAARRELRRTKGYFAESEKGDTTMPKQQTTTKEVENVAAKPPRCREIGNKGIKTGRDLARLFAAMMPDLIDGRVTPSVGNAVCNAGGKLLKVVEMQYRYGTASGTAGRDLTLTEAPPAAV